MIKSEWHLPVELSASISLIAFAQLSSRLSQDSRGSAADGVRGGGGKSLARFLSSSAPSGTSPASKLVVIVIPQCLADGFRRTQLAERCKPRRPLQLTPAERVLLQFIRRVFISIFHKEADSCCSLSCVWPSCSL